MSSRSKLIAAVAAFALIAGGGAVGHYFGTQPGPTPPPAPPTLEAAAKLYAGTGSVAKAQANGWRIEAKAIRAKSPVRDAQAAGAVAIKSAKEADFVRIVGPHLAAIVPEAADLSKDDVAREKLASALERMADAVDPPAKEAVRGPPLLAALFGWQDSDAQRDAGRRAVLAAQLPHRTLSEAAPQIVGAAGDTVAADKKDVFLYKAWREVLGADPSYPAQEIGDCTSFGSGHAVDLLQCIDIALAGGDKSQFRETSTEVIYGLGREIAGMLGRGDGCYGVAVAKGLTDVGALPRETVGAYSGARAKQYGRTGVPADFKKLAAEHKLGAATLVTTLDEADGALVNGYPFIVCSNQGFTMTRDKDGVCEARGTWPHCMFVAGARTLNGERQYLVCQSWGPTAPSGPTTDDQPAFSFWVRGKVMARMLAAQDSLAFSKFAGFVPRPIPDRWTYSGFAKPAPKPTASVITGRVLGVRLVSAPGVQPLGNGPITLDLDHAEVTVENPGGDPLKLVFSPGMTITLDGKSVKPAELFWQARGKTASLRATVAADKSSIAVETEKVAANPIRKAA